MFLKNARAIDISATCESRPTATDVATILSPPLCKGRWHGNAVTKGLFFLIFHEYNPSVSFADSSSTLAC